MANIDYITRLIAPALFGGIIGRQNALDDKKTLGTIYGMIQGIGSTNAAIEGYNRLGESIFPGKELVPSIGRVGTSAGSGYAAYKAIQSMFGENFANEVFGQKEEETPVERQEIPYDMYSQIYPQYYPGV